MAHFAKIGLDNQVTQVLVVRTIDTMTEGGIEKEEIGVAHLTSLTGHSTWKKCSFNTRENVHILGGTPFRFNMPEIGYTYDSLRDGFIPPKPGNDYILIEKKLQWTSMMNWTSQYKEQVNLFRSDDHLIKYFRSDV